MKYLISIIIIFSMMLPVKSAYATKEDEFFKYKGHELFISYPKGKIKKVVMAIHGSGRSARSYRPGDSQSVPFYTHQRDLAIKNGCLFVVVSNGADTWGTDEGMTTLLNVYEYIQKRFKTDSDWILWGTSAGGTLANKMVHKHPEKVDRVLGTFPVYDIANSYQTLPSARKAWKSWGNMRGKNPVSHSWAYTSKPYLIYHGRNDTAVPYDKHSMKFYKEVNKRGGDVTLHIVNGGHTTSNWNVYNNTEISNFIRNAK